ncbi:MAG: agmatinase [Planctomycetota bacterium]|jgi:agmatinase
MSGARTFLGLDEEDSTLDRADVLVLPVPYEGTVTYGGGTARGPAAILEASQQVETWDEELRLDMEAIGYHVLPEIHADPAGADAMAERIHETAARVLGSAGDRFLLSLGGEHSVTPGIVRAFAERVEDLSILHIDAHADMRAEYEGSANSHACAGRRMREIVDTVVSVGIRSLSREEAEYVEREGASIHWARDTAGRTDWIPRAVSELSPNVYLTIDLDGLDPSIMPATGTPEPGGLGWYETLALIRETARARTIVGADIVELAPIEGLVAPDFLAARLALKVVACAREREVRARMSSETP